MAGTCIATVKIIGVTSLGLLTSSLTCKSIQGIPELIKEANYNVNRESEVDLFSSAVSLIKRCRISLAALGTLATSSFALAFTTSTASCQHPYLIYSALGAPLAIAAVYLRSYASERKVLQQANAVNNKEKTQSGSEHVSGKKHKVSQRDDDHTSEDDGRIGLSYIHVSDDETATPVSTSSSSTSHSAGESEHENFQQDLEINKEVETALHKKELVHVLSNLKHSYITGASVAGFGFFIASIGLIGEYYVL